MGGMELTIQSKPKKDCESPYIIVCKAMTMGKPITLQFIGNLARAWSSTIMALRKGDVMVVGGQMRKDNNLLVESITPLTNRPIVGRNFNTFA